MRPLLLIFLYLTAAAVAMSVGNRHPSRGLMIERKHPEAYQGKGKGDQGDQGDQGDDGDDGGDGDDGDDGKPETPAGPRLCDEILEIEKKLVQLALNEVTGIGQDLRGQLKKKCGKKIISDLTVRITDTLERSGKDLLVKGITEQLEPFKQFCLTAKAVEKSIVKATGDVVCTTDNLVGSLMGSLDNLSKSLR